MVKLGFFEVLHRAIVYPCLTVREDRQRAIFKCLLSGRSYLCTHGGSLIEYVRDGSEKGYRCRVIPRGKWVSIL